jgi:hypothetical protein
MRQEAAYSLLVKLVHPVHSLLSNAVPDIHTGLYSEHVSTTSKSEELAGLPGHPNLSRYRRRTCNSEDVRYDTNNAYDA